MRHHPAKLTRVGVRSAMRALTLLEVCLAMALLGLLVSASLPSVRGWRQVARSTVELGEVVELGPVEAQIGASVVPGRIVTDGVATWVEWDLSTMDSDQ